MNVSLLQRVFQEMDKMGAAEKRVAKFVNTSPGRGHSHEHGQARRDMLGQRPDDHCVFVAVSGMKAIRISS